MKNKKKHTQIHADRTVGRYFTFLLGLAAGTEKKQGKENVFFTCS